MFVRHDIQSNNFSEKFKEFKEQILNNFKCETVKSKSVGNLGISLFLALHVFISI